MSKESMIIGRNSVTEALRAGRSISKIYLAAGNQAPALERIRELAGDSHRKRSSESITPPGSG